MLEQDLQKLGFAKNEITVYLALFELGKSRAGKIIERTGLHRNLVYTALEELVRKDLVSKVERGKVAVFEANSPKFLKDGIERQMNIADGVIAELKKRQIAKPRDISVSEGMEGVFLNREKAAQELKAGETYYVLGISEKNTRPEFDSFFAKLNKKILNKGAKIKALFGSASKEMIARRALTYGENAKPLPFGADSPMWFSSYKDLLNISVADSDPVTFSIRSQQAVDGFKKYFEYFWNQPVRMESGMDALHRVFYGMLDELNPGDEYYVFGTALGIHEKYRNFFDAYHRVRIKKGVVVKILSYREHAQEIRDRFFVKGGDPQGKVSFIKSFVSAPPIPMQITLYKNKTRLLFSGAEPAVFCFDQPEVYEGFKKYFDEIWNQDTYILRGPEAIRDLWIESVDAGELRYIGARGYFIDRFPELWKQVKDKADAAKSYRMKNIVDPGVRGHEITKLPYAQTKYLLSSAKNPNVVWLFGNKVVIANWAQNEPVIFVSENRFLVQSYNDYFDELWNKK